MAETPRDQCDCGQCDGHHGHPDGPATAPAAPSVGEPKSQIADLSAAVLAYQSEVAALRSSLEEARKERDQLAKSVKSLSRYDSGETHDDGEGEFVRYDDVVALVAYFTRPPRAPSPRDEP